MRSALAAPHALAAAALAAVISLAACAARAPAAREARTAGPAAAEAANAALFRRSLDELINQQDPSAVDRYFVEDYVQHNEVVAAMAREKGISQRENTKQWFTYMMRAIPDLRVEVEHLVADGDKVFAFLRWTGRHTGGEFLGVPPTNKAIVIRTAEIMRVADGKLVEHWDVTDQSELFRALGFLAPGH